MERDHETSKFALRLAVDWAGGAGVQAGQNKAGDAVEAAEQFERFLMRKQPPGGGRSLADLLEEPAWFDQDWRSEYHAAMTEAIIGRLQFPIWADAIGRSGRAVLDERWMAKGIRGLEAFWVASDSADRLRVDSVVIDSSVFEIPIPVSIKHDVAIAEDEMLTGLALNTEKVISETALSLERQGHIMINGLLQSAGWQPPEDQPPGAFAVPPFRVEIVQRDGWRAKEWVGESDIVWRYQIRGRFGGVAFTLPQADA